MTTTIGLDIGGTKVLGAVVDADGTIVRSLERPSPDDFDPLVDVCAQLVEALDAPGVPVGVGAAGLVDRDGYVRYAPNIPGVRNAPLRDAGFVLFQSSWGPSDAEPGQPLYSQFSVVQNPSDHWPLWACVVLAIGMAWHFLDRLSRFLSSRPAQGANNP